LFDVVVTWCASTSWHVVDDAYPRAIDASGQNFKLEAEPSVELVTPGIP
jgi:hypothetical protein